MNDKSESPNGCLRCNRNEIEIYLKSKGVDPEQVELVNDLDFQDAMPPCPSCGAVFRVKRVRHSIDEDWHWLIKDHADGSKEIFGIQYPNGDRKLAVNMPSQQWKAYLRKGQLKMGQDGKLSVARDRN